MRVSKFRIYIYIFRNYYVLFQLNLIRVDDNESTILEGMQFDRLSDVSHIIRRIESSKAFLLATRLCQTKAQWCHPIGA